MQSYLKMLARLGIGVIQIYLQDQTRTLQLNDYFGQLKETTFYQDFIVRELVDQQNDIPLRVQMQAHELCGQEIACFYQFCILGD